MKSSENIIDIAINNKLKILYILTHKNLYSYYFEGETKPFADPVRLGDNTKDEFMSFIHTSEPTSLAIDQESNDIFIGNTTKEDVPAFPRKLTFGKDTRQKKEFKLEKIGVECQSQKIFLSKAMTSYPRLLIFNIVTNRNLDENKDANHDDKIRDRTNKRDDSLENTRIQTNVSNLKSAKSWTNILFMTQNLPQY